MVELTRSRKNMRKRSKHMWILKTHYSSHNMGILRTTILIAIVKKETWGRTSDP